MHRRKHCVFSAIINRQLHGASARRDLSIIRMLIERDGELNKVWERSSKSAIVYEGNLYFDAFRTCYDLLGFVDKPRLLYQLPKLPSGSKIEQLLMFEYPLDQTSFAQVQGTECGVIGPYSIGLTADNYLKILDFKRGRTLQTIHLSSHHKFKYLSWETDLERIVIKSTLSSHRARMNGMFRLPRDGQAAETLLYLMVLSVSPLQFLCVLPICKSVFGADVCDASIRNGLLIVMHLKGKISFYNFEDILKNNSIPLNLEDYLDRGNILELPEMNEFESGIVGSFPVGLPVNVHLSTRPFVLFQIASDNHDFCFGGYPWHYISSKNHVFHVKSVKDDILVENGTLESNALSLDMAKAFFYADMSGRILHIEPSTLHCLKLAVVSPHDGTTKYSLSEQFSMDFSCSKQATTPNRFWTKSGRCVKLLFDSYHGNIECEVIQDVDYDDELDIFVILYLDQTVHVDDGAVVALVDNQTGHILHKFGVRGISHDGEHSIAIDRNNLVIISKNRNNFNCAVYTLHGKA